MRPGALIGAAAVLVAGVASAGAGSAQPRGVSAAASAEYVLLEQVTLPVSNRPVALTQTYRRGTRYKFVVSGSVTVVQQPAALALSGDPFFRYKCINRSGATCPGFQRSEASSHLIASDAKYPKFSRGSISYFATGGGTNPSFQQSHVYTLFLDDIGGHVTLMRTICCSGDQQTGVFTVKAYLPVVNPYTVRLSVDAQHRLKGETKVRSTFAGKGTLRGLKEHLVPTAPIRFKHVAENGLTYVLRVVSARWNPGRPADALILTTTLESSTNPACAAGSTWRVILRDFPRLGLRADKATMFGPRCAMQKGFTVFDGQDKDARDEVALRLSAAR